MSLVEDYHFGYHTGYNMSHVNGYLSGHHIGYDISQVKDIIVDII
jgi:hypothetical protein